MYACLANDVDTAKALFSVGANIFIWDYTAKTAIHWTAKHCSKNYSPGYIEAICTTYQEEDLLDTKDTDERIALHYAGTFS